MKAVALAVLLCPCAVRAWHGRAPGPSRALAPPVRPLPLRRPRPRPFGGLGRAARAGARRARFGRDAVATSLSAKDLDLDDRVVSLFAATKLRDDERNSDAVECDMARPTRCAEGWEMPAWLMRLGEMQEAGLGSVALLLATALSLGLANSARLSAAWLRFWATPVGPAVAGHALSPRGWINEGLMAIFFFVVGLEIKLELRQGSLSSLKKALLPCIAAVGGMITPMVVYLASVALMGGGSLAALTVPMATDIAFAMAIFGFFRSRMPASSCVFPLPRRSRARSSASPTARPST